MAAFIKSLSRLLGSSAKTAPALHLAAFGKHPGWNDHLDDLGLDTDALISAKRLLYVQGISQNIDSGAWDKLDQPSEGDAAATHAAGASGPGAIGKIDVFRHDFLWSMPPVLLAGRLWSSSDGKGRDKYPMVICSQLTDLPDRFATQIVLPFLADVHQQCASATTAEAVRQIMNTQRENLRGRIRDPIPAKPLAPPAACPGRHAPGNARRPASGIGRNSRARPGSSGICAATAVAPAATAPAAASTGTTGSGFHRIVYQFISGLSAYRTPVGKNTTPRRPEHLRLPACGMSDQEGLLFWLRFAQSLLDASTPILLFAPEPNPAGNTVSPPPWFDLIVGEPSPANLFCIKAGTKSLPFSSDIPYTIELPFIRAIDSHIAACASMPDSAPPPAMAKFLTSPSPPPGQK